MNLPKNITWPKVASAVGGIVFLGLAANFIWMAAIGGAGLIVIGSLCVVAVAGIKSIDLIGQKLDNRILKLQKKEAADNPIEQYQNEFKRRAAILEQTDTALTDKGTALRSMHDMLIQQQKDDPGIDLTREFQDYENMSKDFDQDKILYKEALEGQAEFAKFIQREEFRYKFGQASEKTKRSSAANSKEEAQAAILLQEATNASREKYNRSFAAMEVKMAKTSIKSPAAQQLELKSVVDVVSRTISQVEPIERKG